MAKVITLWRLNYCVQVQGSGWPFQVTLVESCFSKEALCSFLGFRRHVLTCVFSKSAARCIFFLPYSNSHGCLVPPPPACPPPPAFMKPEVYNEKNICVEFEKVGQRSPEWWEALLYHLIRASIGFFEKGSYFILIFSLETPELSSENCNLPRELWVHSRPWGG